MAKFAIGEQVDNWVSPPTLVHPIRGDELRMLTAFKRNSLIVPTCSPLYLVDHLRRMPSPAACKTAIL
jgi:hypothetical protein